MKIKEKLKDRYNIITIAFILFFCVVIFQLVNLQIVNGKKNADLSQRKLVNEWKVMAPRGNIVDRNGVPIAVNRYGFNIQIVKAKLKDSELNAMLGKLCSILEKNGDSYYHSLGKFLMIDPLKLGKNASGNLFENFKREIGYKPQTPDGTATPEDIFNFLKNSYKIDGSYSDKEAYKIITLRYEIRGYNALNPIVIATDVSKNTVAQVEEMHNDFPGVTTDSQPIRKYINAQIASHVMGYVGTIPDDSIKQKLEQGYDMNDLIGLTGVERAAENYLRGSDGLKTIQVDTSGRQTEVLKINKPTVPGNNVQLTLDMRLQKVAADSLKRNIDKIRNKEGDTNSKTNMGDAYAGAVVAIDVNSGEILATASYPDYPPSVFLAGSNDKAAQDIKAALLTNSEAPMVNRAISGTYAPGSTFKPIVAIAGLQEGKITPESVIVDSGTMYVDGWRLTCMEYRNGYGAHGALKLERALATSCNIFFHTLGIKTGIDNIDKWASYFGLGQKTGIDVDSRLEETGILASKEYKRSITKDPWGALDTAEVAIGQYYNNFTPLQLANYVSTLANGGKRYTPHLIKKVLKSDGSTVSETKPEYKTIPVDKANIDAVKKGMIAVTNSLDGTAVYEFQDLPFLVAGKTGTPETGDPLHSSNSVFICYAPANPDKAPQIAIAVVIQRGVAGRNSAPVAHDILEEWVNINNINTQSEKLEPDVPVLTH